MIWQVAMAVLLTVMAGAFVGAIAHELTHAVAAMVLAEEMTMGWQGGIDGGPYVDFRAARRWRSEVIRKAPLALGIVALATAVVGFEVLTLAWLLHAGFALGLLSTSPQDLFISRARASAGE
jgi:hypothetical protein